ncbi:tubulin monoglycylase TTLL3 [Synchiropus splendidus]|uniref:tubulin monoglycylase TTLL3 n=1 Tax=Synchiropus splendidus TaxID=270530 RepID=UPI00237D711D|nr:tubulin monoglycylase TTLL3 [Synchiropus splendidus]
MPVVPAEGRFKGSASSRPACKPDQLKTAKALVEKAVKKKKVFSVQGPYPVIRAALRARGWVERRLPRSGHRPRHFHDRQQDSDDGDDPLVEVLCDGEEVENLDDMYELMSRLVRNERTYFYWTTRQDFMEQRSLRSDQATNHFANSGTFTTKVGLCVNLRNLQWFDTVDPDTFFPRCYKLGAADERQAFIDDFRRTACSSLLTYVVESSKRSRDETQVQPHKHKKLTSHAVVGLEVIHKALEVCEEFLDNLEHRDIDRTADTTTSIEEPTWDKFLHNYYKIVHKGAMIQGSLSLVERCQSMLDRLQEVSPQLDTDGVSNIWIIKPGALSRGRGIMCMNHLEEILTLVDSDRAVTKESKWVVQKYIERPFLINNTKFDIRQWFLVTDWNPLTVWFYGECYVRFSTQPYSTKTLDSSVHLCNNSIQRHFHPSSERHPGLPTENMWSCSQFRAYLQQQGREAEWDCVVIPGMQKAVVNVLQTAQDLVEPRKASFELYGADFILGSDLRPWLLEINSSPTMACSTSVTARLCPAVQLDILKVVLDRKSDPSADTGNFRLIYRQPEIKVPRYVGINLQVEGAPIGRRRCFLPSNNTSTLRSSIDGSAAAEVGKTEDNTVRREEQRTTGEKRQLTSSPKRDQHGRTGVSRMSCTRRFSRSLGPELPLVMNTEPQSKARCLGLAHGSNVTTLVPRSLSLSLIPPQSKQDSKMQNKHRHETRTSVQNAAQTASAPHCRTSDRGCQLPPLKTLHPINHRQHPRQSLGKYKGE